MRTLLGLTLFTALSAVNFATADDKPDTKIDAKKLIGKWSPKDSKKDAGLTIEFVKDGKLTLSIDLAGKTERIEGSYTLQENKLTVALQFGGKEKRETLTITKLTDKELETVDSKMMKEVLLRVKTK